MSVYSSRATAVVVFAVAAASTANAQQSWSPFVGLGSASSAGPLNLPPGVSALVVEPGALLESARGSLLARWSAPITPSQLQLTDADLAMRVRVVSRGSLESSLLATGRYGRTPLDAMANATSAVRLQVGTTTARRGLQIGAGLDGWRSSINRNAVVAPAATISGWIRRFGLAFSAELSARSFPGTLSANSDTARYSVLPDTIGRHSLSTVADTSFIGIPPAPGSSPQATPPAIDAHTFGEAALRVSGMLMSVGIDGQAGVGLASGGQARGFGSIILTKWVSPGLALTGGLVLQPPEPGSSARRAGGLLGIRLASGPRLFPHFVNAPKVGAASCVVRLADGGASIEIRAPGASHVELSGDFTRWLPAAFEHASGDRWVLTAHLTPGVHRFVVRVDGGGWLPAPGLPQTMDAYEGTVSVIVAP